MKSVALCFCVVVTLGLCLVTGWPGNAQSFTSDVLDNQSVTLTDRNLIFLGHSTAFWDSSRKTESSARQLIQLGQQYGITRVATVARHMMKDPGLAGLHYFSQSDVNLVLESRAGNHRLVLPNLKNIFFVGGNLNRCLCEGIRDAAIGFAGSQGNFELNVFKPVRIHNFLHSVRLIKDACRMFVEHCVNGIQINKEKIDGYVNNSLMLVTALSPKVGYDNAAKIAHTAHHENLSLKQACVKLGFLNETEFDELVRPEKMTQP